MAISKKNSDKPLRGFRYARYSDDHQQEESIEAQLAAIDRYFAHNNIITVGTFIDRGKSATNDRRPDFQRMMREAKKGKVDIVAVHKVNRFARNRYDAAYYKRQLKQLGVTLKYIELPDDEGNHMILLESVLEGFAEFFSKDLSTEVRKVMRPKAEKGLHLGGVPPYGLKVNYETMQYEIDERENQAVQIYFNGIKNGWSLVRIADACNHLGLRTRKGGNFTKNSFDGWGRNRKYRGDYEWDKRTPKTEDGSRNDHSFKPIDQRVILEGAIPPSVDPEIWDEVQNILEQRQRKPGAFKTKIAWLLSGKIHCGVCGRRFEGDSYRNKKSSENTLLTYYRCSDHKCSNSKIRKDDIESVTIEKLVEACFTKRAMNDVIQILQTIYQKEKESMMQSVAPIKRELADLDRKINNWLEMAGEGIKSVLVKIKEAEARKEDLEEELIRVEYINAAATQLDEKMIKRILETKKHSLLSDDEDEKKQVLQEFVDRIVINASKINEFECEITLRVMNDEDFPDRTGVSVVEAKGHPQNPCLISHKTHFVGEVIRGTNLPNVNGHHT